MNYTICNDCGGLGIPMPMLAYVVIGASILMLGVCLFTYLQDRRKT